MPDIVVYDVAICGGGLAGLALARQLKLKLPDLTVLVLERTTRPLPLGAFKVGESTQEAAAHYLTETLQLTSHFQNHQIRKLGLRFFFGDSQGPFEERPEHGLTDLSPAPAYQIDRGILESELRRTIVEDGVELIEDCAVEDIVLGPDGNDHQVLATVGAETRTFLCRWVADATGRRRLLQKKLGLTQRVSTDKYSASWFRIPGRVDVADLVPPSASAWLQRTKRPRYQSTNHLMGDGRWVWLIPLASNITSIGIVALEKFHPFEEFSTYAKAMEWLRRHEPVLAARIANEPILDFRVMRDYSYASKRVISADRWSCVGDAGVFSDPFFSSGSELIAMANTITVRCIEQSRKNALTAQEADRLDLVFRSFHNGLTFSLQSGYPYFGRDAVMSCKLIWDTATGWAFSGPLLFNWITLDPQGDSEAEPALSRFSRLSYGMQDVFTKWAAVRDRSWRFDFVDYLEIPFMRELHVRNLREQKPRAEILDDLRVNLAVMEDLAAGIRWLATQEISGASVAAASASLPPVAMQIVRLFSSKIRSEPLAPAGARGASGGADQARSAIAPSS